MDLINQKITHKVFGEGSIVSHDDSLITVDFNNETKVFVYPDAIGDFITLKDEELAQSMKKVVRQLKSEEEELKKEEKEERKQKLIKKNQKRKLKNRRLHESLQEQFKVAQTKDSLVERRVYVRTARLFLQLDLKSKTKLKDVSLVYTWLQKYSLETSVMTVLCQHMKNTELN